MPELEIERKRVLARQILTSFSGVDGSGKSSQIQALTDYLESQGLRVLRITFWDDVATLTGMRESAGHTLFHGERGVGTPEAPVKRRDKNIRTPWMSLVRTVLYLLDTISLRKNIRAARSQAADWVICDRYIYDELANLNLHNPAARAFARLMARIAPVPDISYLLDADPAAACARKPEYPVEFVESSRKAYFELNRLIGGTMSVIEPMPLEGMKAEVLGHAKTVLGDSLVATASHTPERGRKADPSLRSR